MNNNKKGFADLSKLFFDFQEDHRNVFIAQLEDEVFFYRSLGRSELKNIASDQDLNDFEKQDIICELCTLWPENYDFNSCPAGIPTELYKLIIENSHMDSLKSKKAVLTYYRQEMFELENQITCVINEAFPQYDIEEIEQWDVEKTLKYMSRAEWKLQNLRGLEFNQSDDIYGETEQEHQEEFQQENVSAETTGTTQDHPSEKNLRGESKHTKLSPEKLEEMRKMQEKFPEINFFADTILNEGESGMIDNVDVVPPALRPGM